MTSMFKVPLSGLRTVSRGKILDILWSLERLLYDVISQVKISADEGKTYLTLSYPVNESGFMST